MFILDIIDDVSDLLDLQSHLAVGSNAKHTVDQFLNDLSKEIELNYTLHDIEDFVIVPRDRLAVYLEEAFKKERAFKLIQKVYQHAKIDWEAIAADFAHQTYEVSIYCVFDIDSLLEFWMDL